MSDGRLSVEISHVLSEEQLDQIAEQVLKTTLEAIEQAKQSASYKRLLSRKQACEFLGISPQTLQQFVIDGLPEHRASEKIYYYDRDEVIAFIKNK